MRRIAPENCAKLRQSCAGTSVLERQVGQFGLVRPHAEAVGERREDLDGLARDAQLLVPRHVLERPHVVQSIGELDDDDPCGYQRVSKVT